MKSWLLAATTIAIFTFPITAPASMVEARSGSDKLTQGEDPAVAVFSQLDTDGNGYIDREEASRSSRVTEDFDEVDVDRDGRISPEEWETYFNYPS